MLSDGISEVYRVQIFIIFWCMGKCLALELNQSCQFFDFFFQFFPQHFVHNLDYPILQLQVSLDVCAHIPLTLWIFISHVVLITTDTLEPIMQFATPLSPLHEMLTFTWDENNYMHFFQSHSILFVDELTHQKCAHQI